MCLRIIFVSGQIGLPDQCPKRLESTQRVTNFFCCTDPPLRLVFPFPRPLPLKDDCLEPKLHEKDNRDSCFLSEICVCLTDGGDSFVHDSGTSRRSSVSCTFNVSSRSSTTGANSSISRSKAAVKSVSSSPDSSSSEIGSSYVSRASVSWAV